MTRIDVFYGRTDNTPGYKEYSCVVVETSETAPLRYYGDLYEPQPGCNYKILYEVDMSAMDGLYKKAGVKRLNMVGWVQSPLKEVVLQYWHDNKKKTATTTGMPMFVGVRGI